MLDLFIAENVQGRQGERAFRADVLRKV